MQCRRDSKRSTWESPALDGVVGARPSIAVHREVGHGNRSLFRHGPVRPGVRGETVEMMLTRRAAGGDSDAYARLFLRSEERIRRTLWPMVLQETVVDDVVQETFLRALKSLPGFRGEAQPVSWLSSIALNICRTYRRIDQRDRRRAESNFRERRLRAIPSPAEGGLTRLLREEAARELTGALATLTSLQRRAFLLHCLEERPYREVAEILRVREGTARALGFRARRTLRRRLAAV